MTRTAAIPVSEFHEQAALFDWARLHTAQYPDLAMLFHPPNEGRRAPQTAALIGLSPGLPDLMLPCRGFRSIGTGYVGFARELKTVTRFNQLERKHGLGGVTPAQRWWLDALEAQGWHTGVTVFDAPGDWIIAAGLIASYLGMPADTVGGVNEPRALKEVLT